MAWSLIGPSHYLNQCWVIVNSILRNKLQWNLTPNTKFFIHKNAARNIVCEMAAILYRGRWVKSRSYMRPNKTYVLRVPPKQYNTADKNAGIYAFVACGSLPWNYLPYEIRLSIWWNESFQAEFKDSSFHKICWLVNTCKWNLNIVKHFRM